MASPRNGKRASCCLPLGRFALWIIGLSRPDDAPIKVGPEVRFGGGLLSEPRCVSEGRCARDRNALSARLSPANKLLFLISRGRDDDGVLVPDEFLSRRLGWVVLKKSDRLCCLDKSIVIANAYVMGVDKGRIVRGVSCVVDV